MANAPAQAGTAPDFRLSRGDDGRAVVEVTGVWNLRALESVVSALTRRLAACAPDAQWDLRNIVSLDHAGALLLWRAWGRKRAASLLLRAEHEPLFEHLARPREAVARRGPVFWRAPLEFFGRAALGFADHLVYAAVLLGRVVLDTAQLVRRPAQIPWREISANVYRAGAQALPITALVGFLIGVVLSYLSAQQLKIVGADIFIVNLLGVSIVRELGPVLAAILVAGRSGSAFTAQLGVMRVTEELDAMTVMGIPHTLRLILPRMIALGVAMPLIILWTDAIALVGGMVAAQAELGLGYRYFFSALPDAVPIANLWLGLGKGVVFGILIALVACHFGLRIEPNTESLGIGTTNSVVASITIVIIVDAIFAVMFSDVGSFR
jgi:phospholipid/cholesterol/gamma-HCH transport system permease protein